MKCAVLVVLLLLQLRPIAGAALCMRPASDAEPRCEMSGEMETARPVDGPALSTPAAHDDGCILAAVCAPSGPTVVTMLAPAIVAVAQVRAPDMTVPTVLGVDALAPPAPPPNS